MPDATGARVAAPIIARKATRASTSSPLIGTVIDERYRLHAVIGRGGFGTVFEAENLRFGGRVALKLLEQCDKSTIRRFNQEARIAGTVLHPNVCHVFDVGWVNDRPYCVMELLTGETLAARLERSGALSVSAAIDLAIQVRGGLAAAHDAGVVHRDVKPQNVFMVHRQGVSPAVKLLDFGLAKALDPLHSGAKVRGTATMPGRVVGTVAYMSPEQLLGESIDGRSDLFSCAVVLYEAVTGALPWRGRTRADIGTAILRDTPKPVAVLRPQTPPELDTILERGLTKDRTKRYQSAYEFLRALASLQRSHRSMIVAPTVAEESEESLSGTTEVARPSWEPPPAATDSEETARMSAPPSSISDDLADLTSSASDPISSTSAEVPRVPRTTQPILPRLYNVPPSNGSGSSN